MQGSSVAAMVAPLWWRPFSDCDEQALVDFCETVLQMYAQFDAATVCVRSFATEVTRVQGVDAPADGTAVADGPSPGGSPRAEQGVQH